LLGLFHLIARGIVPAILKHALPVHERFPVLQQTVPIETPSNMSDKLGIATGHYDLIQSSTVQRKIFDRTQNDSLQNISLYGVNKLSLQDFMLIFTILC
jgi:hypothetical protein